MEGFVHSMETFGLVDGPGVRFVVFLQGCRMRCRYCHNPETWKLEGGTPWTADKLFSHVYRYKSYWNKKGQPNGGITVSGGEPLLQIDFVTEFFKKAREKGVHTALDTAGNPFTLEEPFISKFEELMKVTDLVILDFKEIDNEKHKKLTGCPNDCIKARTHDFGIIGMTLPLYERDRCVSCGACVKKCKRLSTGALKMENYKIVRDHDKCIGCGECVLNCPTSAWTRDDKK